MQHTFTTEGFGVRLRPVRMEDAAFIVWLRHLEHTRGRIGDTAPDVAAQREWLLTYFKREGDYYFIIETTGGFPVGAYGTYNMADSSAESGRWIIRTEVPAAVPCAILAFDLAFGKMGLGELRAATVSTNQSVLSLNKKFGFRQVGVDHKGQMIGGKPVDLVRFVMKADEWLKPRERLLPLAKLAEAQVLEWESAQSLSKSAVNL